MARQVWQELQSADNVLDQLPDHRLWTLLPAVTAHVQHTYLMLNRISLPPGSYFQPLPAWKPFPPDEQLIDKAVKHLRLCCGEPRLLASRRRAEAGAEPIEVMNEHHARQYAAQLAPVTKLKRQGELVADLELRLFTQLLRETVQWGIEVQLESCGPQDLRREGAVMVCEVV